VNFLPISGVTKVYGGPNVGLTTVATTAYTVGQWNHARIVVEEKTKEEMTETETYQPMSLYINGTLIKKDVSLTLNANDKLKGGKDNGSGGFRFNIGGDSSTVAYVADAVLTESDSNEAPEMPSLASVDGKYRVSGSGVNLASKATTVADLQQTGLAVRAYAAGDTTMATALADDYVLVGGETIVVEDTANKRYTYYTSVMKTTTIMGIVEDGSSDKISLGNHFTASKDETGYAGKPGASIKLTVTPTTNENGTTSTTNTYFDVTGATLMDVNTPEYAVLEFGINPGSQSFAFFTEQSANIFNTTQIATINRAVVKNKWNKVALVIKNGSTADNATQRSTIYSSYTVGSAMESVHTADLYINGSKVIADGELKAYGYKWTTNGYTRTATCLRIKSHLTTAGDAIYVDDLHLYEMDCYDEEDFTAAMPSITSKNEKRAIIGGNTIRIGATDVTVDDFNVPEGCTATVYTDSTYSAVSTSALEEGNVITVCDGKAVSYYTVTDILYDLDVYDELKASWGNASYSSIEGTDGAGDTAVSAKLSADTKQGNVFFYKNWDVSKFGFDKYTVYQADVKFGENGSSFFVGSNEHDKISPSILRTNPKIKDGWNTITIVSAADGGATNVYINGIYDCSGTSLVTRDNYDSKYTQLRFIAFAASNTDRDNAVVSLDNILVYTTDIAPEFGDTISGSCTADTGATFTAGCDYGTLVVAAYKGDDMIEAKYIDITADQNTITLNTAEATQYVGFVWDNMTKLGPMCESLKVSVPAN
ncbi:MAG: hypothetical protein IJ365_00045, partial [Clostridia bacterium]|nr:hypothetical protein [Clostridia bacterium]